MGSKNKHAENSEYLSGSECDQIDAKNIGEVSSEELEDFTTSNSRRDNRRSLSWNFYTKLNKFSAKCMFCPQVISIKHGSIGNLGRHLRSKHGQVVSKSISGKTLHNLKRAPKMSLSLVWGHFHKLDLGRDQCNYCARILIGSKPANMFRHLLSKHPDLQLKKNTHSVKDVRLTKNQSTESYNNVDGNIEEKELCNLESKPLRKQLKSLWHHFVKIDKIAGKCVHCGVHLKLHSLTNLRRHLQRKHGIATPSCANKDLKSIKSSKKIHERVMHSNNEFEINKHLMKLITNSFFSMAMLDNEDFITFVQLVSQKPGYQLPSKNTFSESLMSDIYETILNEIKTNLDSALAVCLSIDCWSSKEKKDFMIITAHYVNNDPKFCTNVLECIEYDQNNTSENILELLINFLERWSLTEKIEAFVSNKFEILNALQLGKFRAITCFSHLINCCAVECLNKVSDIVMKIRNLSLFLKKNPEALNVVRDIQQQLEQPLSKVIIDNPKYWHTTYEMIKKCNDQKLAFNSALTLMQEDLALTESEWLQVGEVIKVLRPFYVIVNEIKQEKVTPLSKVILYCNLIEKLSLKWIVNENESETITGLKIKAKEVIEKKLCVFEKSFVYAEATILDPRFMTFGFNNKKQVENIITELKDNLIQLNLGGEPEETTLSDSGNQDEELIWNDFDEKIKNIKNQNPKNSIEEEINRFTADSPLNRTEDPLRWWHDRKTIYPRLYNCALKKFCLVASSVDGEKLYTKSGIKSSEKQEALKAKHVSKFVFLQSNLEKENI